ncbi:MULTISPECIES: glycerophosphoryl diester phosphodiesterase membrane domain-containing protein [Protofrankia]|uniref:Glycerophosphoryl diester phosphodiesterase, membrane domain protein n=1 Tax=Candidatus Protofrankia datiscae TaxID=2716812 RepID=F8B2J7_9ACTN|nr:MULTISPECIES: glycerophosphoryl diester phosphodiesterase membrane domain-containing protein [Protofrankia]AEH08603.1 Glycerophosphoryl diester phosphodiesterase, membrane domain protein [Candidatus Protofrankia datiscae]
MTGGPGWGNPQPPGGPNPADGRQQPPPPGWGQPQPPPSDWNQPSPPPCWHQSPPGWGQPRSEGPGQWGPLPRAEKPGIIPLRPLAVGEILDGAFAALRSSPAAMIGLTFGATTATQIIAVILAEIGQRGPTGVMFLLAAANAIIIFVTGGALAGTLSVVVGELTLGSSVRIGEALRRVRPRLASLTGLSIVVPLLALIGFAGFVLGGIFVAVALALSIPVLVLEGGTIRTAMRRSWTLVRGAWWRIFGVLLLTGIVVAVLLSVLAFVVVLAFTAFTNVMPDPASGDLTGLDLALSTIMSIIFYTVIVSVMASVATLLYVDRRIRLEGLDMTLAQAAQERRAATGQGPQ